MNRTVQPHINDYKSRERQPLKTPLYVLFFLLSCPLFLVSCGSSKPKVITTKKEARKYGSKQSSSKSYTMTEPKTEEASVTDANMSAPSDVDIVVATALDYQGTRYKYGGTTRSGMDCSGLICTAYNAVGKNLPRTSTSMHQQAVALELEELRKGDFIFFATGRNKRKVNHVALVTQVTPAEIRFIHSTTSRGVIVSSLNEAYWLKAYVSAGRME